MISLADFSPVSDTVGCFAIKELIGTGSFASVWLAEHPASHLPVAIKAIPASTLAREDLRTHFVREVTLMKQLDHPFIGKLYQVIETPEFVYLVQEYVENGTLLSYVEERARLPEAQARRYFTELIAALDYLHSQKRVAHRDIKAENVLLDAHLNIRLIDFGLSHAFTESDPHFHSSCGSPGYASPEMIQGKSYTKAADIWSAGILLFAMVAGELPFTDSSGLRAVLEKIISTEPKYPPIMSPVLVDLLRRILVKSPQERISLAQIKAHPWFSQSEDLRIFDMSFNSEEWLVHGIDKTLIDEMARMGIDVRPVVEAILCGEYTDETAVYSMLRRRNIMEKVHHTMKKPPRLSHAATTLTFPDTPFPEFGSDGSVPEFMKGSQAVTRVPPRKAPIPSPALCRPRRADGSSTSRRLSLV
jgi:serine/threonine protein kinase